MRYDFDQVKADVVGRWPGIFERFGIDVGAGEHKSCPVCGGTDRFRFINKDGNGTWFCNGCDPKAGDGWALFQNVLMIDFKSAIEKIGPLVSSIPIADKKTPLQYNKKRMQDLYRSSRPIRIGDIAYKYLASRGLSRMKLPSLRISEKCYEPETEKNHIAMLAIFQDHDGDALTMHRTYLSPEAGKLKIKSPKKLMTPKAHIPGGAVRLYEWESGPLGIAEGIETAIAVSIIREIPVWAALNSQLLSSFRPPKGADIEIYGDNDTNFAGQHAAYTLANRLSIEGRKVSVNIPDKPGTDFLDELIDEI